MSIEPDSSYDYKVGGVVPLNNLTYVKRKADEDLYKWLKAGEFCYVLNSRQMGKTSLLIRTLRRLERAGFVCANIDISGEIGTDLENPKQWYSTLLEIIADSFNLDFPGWWNECKSLPPIRQLSKFIENVLLDSVEENVVIFIDEIDSVLGLEFNVDDFFAFIRACYNKREFNQKYKRLTFTLFGVATPADLIKDKQRTPFNIGKAVELHGFQFNEAQRLAQGFAGKLNNPQRILQLVLDWTGGQPFLTQKLCDLLLKSPSSVPIDDEVSWLEQIVRTQVIEDWEYHDEPQHLKTIRDRLLRNEQHTSRLLGLYQQILQNGKVKVDNSLEQMELLLSGLVVKQQGMLKVYNRIYETVFNLCWVDQVLADLRPYAEQIESWLKSNCQEESKLLRGTALQAAMDWKIGKKLSDDDYNFLTASRDKEAEREQTKMAQELVGNVSNALALYREVQLWTGEQSFLSDYFYKLIGNYSFPISEGSEVEFVEDLVQNFIKNWESKKETKYLRTIQEHILSNNDQASNLLKIYKQILQQGELIFDQSKEQQELIKIGLVIKHQEKLKVANRICEFVFNLSWVNEILSSMVLVADPELPEGQVDLASVSPINQSSTANQDQNVGSVTDNSIVFRDVYGNVYFGTYKRPATGAPFQVPYLPQYFVERPEHHKQIKTRLLSNQGNRTGTLVVSAIYGLGGIGKSTLAAAVAHDPQVQAQFSDGVLWVTLGQQPDLLSLLSAWIQALGDYDYKPLTLDGASRHLRTLLHDKKALLVVDDVWNPEHVEPFRVGGSSCQLLVTTREATIKGAISYDLNVMTPDESLELLQKSQNNPLTKAEQQQAQQLAQTVGYLPLALDLAAAQVADGVSWQELLEDLRSEIARLESLQTPGADSCIHEEQRKHYSLIASFRLSLRWLTPEMLRQFAWFGVLPEDVVITHTMAAMLWEINPRQALTTLRSFKAKALLLAGATGDNQKQTYRLHDLMHDVAKRLLTSDSSPHKPEELPGLGLSLTAAHSILLDQYRSKTEQGLWHTLPDDGYIHANLSWHLEQASRTEELHQLLMEETAQGRNGWYETCERLGQTGNFVTDVARAWRLAEEMFEENPSKSIALQCRYALITTSLNSLAKNIPGHLMAALVKQKLWSPAQGLAYAQQVKESEQRAEALGALAPHLSKSLLAIALDAARVIQDDYYRATALGGLAPYLPEILQQALDSVRSIEDDYYRATAL
ncbi:AAA-like domain-containing protein, partial [Scytonema sp. PRP1]|uniref:AAA-like domain-containing protein n=1 Tax=Scytonema sp. PRP1 TaxID=3120513 RepID=UPI002FD154E1